MKKNNEIQYSNDWELPIEVLNAITDTDKLDFSDTLQSIHDKATKPRIIYINSWINKSIAAAVAVILVVGGSVITYKYVSNQTLNSVYSGNFNPDISLLVSRGYDISENAAISKGVSCYKNGDYKLAIELFETNNDDIVATLYSGFCYMKFEEFDRAIVNFKLIISDDDNLFVDQAEWNLGLCYLKIGKENLAKSMFNHVINEKGAFRNKAKILLQKLE